MMIITRSNDASATLFDPTIDEVKRKFIDYNGIHELVHTHVKYLFELCSAKDIEEFVEIWNRNTDDFEDGSTLKYYESFYDPYKDYEIR